MQQVATNGCVRVPWNKGKIAGQKPPLKRNEIWAIRVRLQFSGRVRDLALFNLAIDSKLRACDLMRMRVRDVIHGCRIARRAIVMQRKNRRPVQFEITDTTRAALREHLDRTQLASSDYLFPSRINRETHLSTRQYAKLVKNWVEGIGLDPGIYGTHSLRRPKATLIYR